MTDDRLHEAFTFSNSTNSENTMTNGGDHNIKDDSPKPEGNEVKQQTSSGKPDTKSSETAE